jgi:hypothetical protein
LWLIDRAARHLVRDRCTRRGGAYSPYGASKQLALTDAEWLTKRGPNYLLASDSGRRGRGSKITLSDLTFSAAT